MLKTCKKYKFGTNIALFISDSMKCLYTNKILIYIFRYIYRCMYLSVYCLFDINVTQCIYIYRRNNVNPMSPSTANGIQEQVPVSLPIQLFRAAAPMESAGLICNSSTTCKKFLNRSSRKCLKQDNFHDWIRENFCFSHSFEYLHLQRFSIQLNEYTLAGDILFQSTIGVLT